MAGPVSMTPGLPEVGFLSVGSPPARSGSVFSPIISDALLPCGHFLGSIRAAAGYASNDN